MKDLEARLLTQGDEQGYDQGQGQGYGQHQGQGYDHEPVICLQSDDQTQQQGQGQSFSASAFKGKSKTELQMRVPRGFRTVWSIVAFLCFVLLVVVFLLGLSFHANPQNSSNNPLCMFSFSQAWFGKDACDPNSAGSASSSGKAPAKSGNDPEPVLPAYSMFNYQWALLVAGSSGWWNYRHQSDVCHAYHVLSEGGVPKDHITVMMYDDVAYNEFNPFQGELFNAPGGKDVYTGVPHDYTGKKVTKQNFINALQGDSNGIKVLNSNSSDHVFLYYADHGGPGFLNFPNNELMMADEFNKLILDLYNDGKFQEMVIYVEACNSGSMFQGMLPKNVPVYVTTAADPYESSYATYCPSPNGFDSDKYISTCLGDLYSVSWMENSQESDLQEESLQYQYAYMRNRTSQNFTYKDGSHVMWYGDDSLTTEAAGNYLGIGNPQNLQQQIRSDGYVRLQQRDADLLPMVLQYATNSDKLIRTVLRSKVQRRHAVDVWIRESVEKALGQTQTLLSGLDVDSFVSSSMDRNGNEPIVDDWDCYREMIQTWQSKCGNLDNYELQYGYAWANLCNAGVAPAEYGKVLVSICTQQQEQQISLKSSYSQRQQGDENIWKEFIAKWNKKLDMDMQP